MNFETLLHILCISGSIICTVTMILYLIFKKCGVLQKINASVYFIALGVYLLYSETMLKFVQNYYLSPITYNSIMLFIINFISVFGVLLVLIGLFYKNDKFQKYSYRAFEFIILVLSIVLIINAVTSFTKNVFLAPIIFLTLIFSEHFMINATETLDCKASKLVYFIVNSGLAVVWMIGILALAVKISFNFNLTYIILSISAFIISFCSIIFGILRIKRKKSND